MIDGIKNQGHRATRVKLKGLKLRGSDALDLPPPPRGREREAPLRSAKFCQFCGGTNLARAARF